MAANSDRCDGPVAGDGVVQPSASGSDVRVPGLDRYVAMDETNQPRRA